MIPSKLTFTDSLQRWSARLFIANALPYVLVGLGILITLLMIIILIGGALTGIFREKPETVNPDLGDTEWIITAEGKKLIPTKYTPIYQKIGNKYGVPWNLLAAIHRVETSFGQNLSVSSAGAVGHFQSMPCNWLGWNYYKDQCTRLGKFKIEIDLTDPKNLHGGQAVDENKDGKIEPNNIYDSMATAAKRLANDKKRTKKGWFEKNGPVWKYNPSSAYVEKVKKYFYRFAKAKQPEIAMQAKMIHKGGKFSWPTQGTITSYFAEDRGTYRHKGIDIGAPKGTPIYAVADGVVTRRKTDPGGFGYYVVISHGTVGGKSVETWYGHMYKKTVIVEMGEKVKEGQPIAKVGSNGRSTGPHLHFEVRVNGKPVNPLHWIGK